MTNERFTESGGSGSHPNTGLDGRPAAGSLKSSPPESAFERLGRTLDRLAAEAATLETNVHRLQNRLERFASHGELTPEARNFLRTIGVEHGYRPSSIS